VEEACLDKLHGTCEERGEYRGLGATKMYGGYIMDNKELEAIKKNIEEFYKQNHLLINGEDVLLHENCKFKDDCWKKQAIQEHASDWNRIAFPYIGDEYDGFICIGINLNECGGKNALSELINGNDKHLGVKKYLEKRCKRIKFNHSPYPGTILWHRIGVYANIILNNEITPDHGKNLSDIYNKIAFLEAIKCSPKNNRSEPEGKMPENCPGHIMKKEIELLKPKIMLLLGSTASPSIRDAFGCNNLKNKGDVAYYEIKVDGNVVKVFRIIHPTARRGNRINLYKKLYDIKNEML
jgi:hypothetical protein